MFHMHKLTLVDLSSVYRFAAKFDFKIPLGIKKISEQSKTIRNFVRK